MGMDWERGWEWEGQGWEWTGQDWEWTGSRDGNGQDRAGNGQDRTRNGKDSRTGFVQDRTGSGQDRSGSVMPAGMGSQQLQSMSCSLAAQLFPCAIQGSSLPAEPARLIPGGNEAHSSPAGAGEDKRAGDADHTTSALPNCRETT